MIRPVFGAPVLLLRRLVADPICWLDEALGSGKPVRRSVKREVDMSHFLDDADKPRKEKDRLERALADLAHDEDICREIIRQLHLFDHAELVITIKNTDDKFETNHHTLHKQITESYASPLGIEATIHVQGKPNSDKPLAIVVYMSRRRLVA